MEPHDFLTSQWCVCCNTGNPLGLEVLNQLCTGGFVLNKYGSCSVKQSLFTHRALKVRIFHTAAKNINEKEVFIFLAPCGADAREFGLIPVAI
jgi:hypothetical protein